MTRRLFLLLILLSLLAAALLWWPLALLSGRSPFSSAPIHCQTPIVQDGDSLLTRCGDEEQRLRLHCIDAPERDQLPWSEASRHYLQSLLGQPIRIRVETQDKYGRLVAEVWRADAASDQPSINQQMVQAGQAVVFRRYCSETQYYEIEQQARQARLGVWARRGDQQRPWRFRYQRRLQQNKSH